MTRSRAIPAIPQLSQHLRQRIHSQMCCVGGSFRQSAQGFQELLPFQRAGFSQRFPGNHLRETGAGGDRGDTAARAEAHLDYAAIGEFDRQLHDVAAHGMLQSHFGIRPSKLTHVARVFEVIENNF